MHEFLNLKFNANIVLESYQDDDPLNDLEFMNFLSSSSPTSSTSSFSSVEASPKNKKQQQLDTKFGKCEHPKHLIYRQEHFLASQTAKVSKTVPRRGRPPKGSNIVVELTVRPLPKRLEAVVGKKNIKVCLTCLKRSDLDKEYVESTLYVGPQQCQKKKRT